MVSTINPTVHLGRLIIIGQKKRNGKEGRKSEIDEVEKEGILVGDQFPLDREESVEGIREHEEERREKSELLNGPLNGTEERRRRREIVRNGMNRIHNGKREENRNGEGTNTRDVEVGKKNNENE